MQKLTPEVLAGVPARRRTGARRRAWCCALRALVWVSLAQTVHATPAEELVASGAVPADATGKDQVRKKVLRYLHSAQDGTGISDSVISELSSLGPPAIPILFGLLEAGEWEEPGPTGELVSFVLTEEHKDGLSRALGALPRPQVRAFLYMPTIPQAGEKTRRAAIQVLGYLGTARDLEYVIELSAPGADSSEVSAVLGAALARAAAEILRRDQDGYDVLKIQLKSAENRLGTFLLDAIGRAASTRGLWTLHSVLLSQPEHKRVAITQIGVTATSLVPPIETFIVDGVRRFLDDAELAIQKETVIALGKLQDFESIPLFIEFLEHENSGMRKAAHWALKYMSGLNFLADSRRWKSWYQVELNWWAQKSNRIRRSLRVGSKSEIAAAINEMAMRRLFRHELAQDMAVLLRSRDPALRKMACVGVMQMNSRAVVPELIECLDDVDDSVREAACSALKSLLKRELPCETEAWRRVVQ